MLLKCDLRDTLSHVIYYRGFVDRSVDAKLDAWLRPGDTYVDVGAHVGYFVSRAARRIGRSGHIVAIEPNPATFAKLAAALSEANRELGPISLVQAACGEEPGRAALHVPTAALAHEASRASLIPAGNTTSGPTVEIRRLDEIVADIAHIRLLKVDTEGFEPSVLAGAGDALSRTDAVLIEVNPDALALGGHEPEDLFGLFDRAGFVPDDRADPRRAFSDVLFRRK